MRALAGLLLLLLLGACEDYEALRQKALDAGHDGGAADAGR